jgi:hypothetical protein
VAVIGIGLGLGAGHGAELTVSALGQETLGGGRAVEVFDDRDLDPQLFERFPYRRLRGGFARFDPATREHPVVPTGSDALDERDVAITNQDHCGSAAFWHGADGTDRSTDARDRRPWWARPAVAIIESVNVANATELVAAEIERLEHELTRAASGQSLCALSRSAGSVPGVKYLEGRLVAAGDLARSLTGESPCAQARTLLHGWTDALAAVTNGRFGPDWVAYRAGGVDELAEILQLWGCAPSGLRSTEGHD